MSASRQKLAAAMLEAANGGRGALDGWLETVNEGEVREAVLGMADLRANDRRQFAAMAMQGCLANHGLNAMADHAVAEFAVRQADSLLAELEKQP